jgi:hypothetical protein
MGILNLKQGNIDNNHNLYNTASKEVIEILQALQVHLGLLYSDSREFDGSYLLTSNQYLVQNCFASKF